jgi:uncharacterized protein YuzE
MRIIYDTEVDALTLVVNRETPDRTIDVGEGRFIDVDEEGNIIALEILDVSEGFQLTDLIERGFNLAPLLEDFAEHVQKARMILREPELRDALAR